MFIHALKNCVTMLAFVALQEAILQLRQFDHSVTWHLCLLNNLLLLVPLLIPAFVPIVVLVDSA